MAQLAKKRKASTALETGASTPRKAQERGIRVYARVSKPVAAASKAIEGKKNGIVAVVEHGSGVDDGDDDGGPREEGPTAMKIKKRKLERATGIVVAVDNGDAPEAGSMGEDVAAAAVADQSSCRSTTTLDRLQSHGLSRSMQMKKVILLAGAAKVSTATARARANVSAQERGKSLLERVSLPDPLRITSSAPRDGALSGIPSSDPSQRATDLSPASAAVQGTARAPSGIAAPTGHSPDHQFPQHGLILFLVLYVIPQHYYRRRQSGYKHNNDNAQTHAAESFLPSPGPHRPSARFAAEPHLGRGGRAERTTSGGGGGARVGCVGHDGQGSSGRGQEGVSAGWIGFEAAFGGLFLSFGF